MLCARCTCAWCKCVHVHCALWQRTEWFHKTMSFRAALLFSSMPSQPSVSWAIRVLLKFNECLQANKSKMKPQSYFHKMLKHSHSLKTLFDCEGSGGHAIHKFKYKDIVSQSYVLNFKNHGGAIAREQNIATWSKAVSDLIMDLRCVAASV
jgi:hypothetical protein